MNFYVILDWITSCWGERKKKSSASKLVKNGNLNFHGNFFHRRDTIFGKLGYLSVARQQSPSHSPGRSILIIYSSEFTVSWQPLPRRRWLPESLHSLSICFNDSFQRVLLDEHSHFLPVLEIKYLIQGHIFQQGINKKQQQWSFWISPPHFLSVLISRVTRQASAHLLLV